MIHYCSECGAPGKSVNGIPPKFCGQCGQSINKSFSSEYVKPKPKVKAQIVQEYEEEYEEEEVETFRPIRKPKKLDCEVEIFADDFRVPIEKDRANYLSHGDVSFSRDPQKPRSKKARAQAREEFRQSIARRGNINEE